MIATERGLTSRTAFEEMSYLYGQLHCTHTVGMLCTHALLQADVPVLHCIRSYIALACVTFQF